jgi:hypothetical protein
MITVTQQPTPPAQVFSLATPHHMMMKLAWEKRNLHAAIAARKNNEEPDFKNHHAAAYFAFNFAVTAWHIVDWVWQTTDDEWRDTICKSLKCKKDYDAFKKALMNQYRVIRICQQIANGSKHMRINKPDNSIRVDTAWARKPALAGQARAGDSLGRYDFDLLIWDDGKERNAIEVFDEVFRCWEGLLSSWFFIEG